VPITHATTPLQVEEEKRLLYVGVTRARRHLALSWAAARAAAKEGRQSRRSRKISRFLEPLAPTARTGRPAGAERPKQRALSDDPLVQALREWRLDRARADGVPAYVVFDNKTLEAIAQVQPRDAGELASVPGVGPKKLELYADDVLAVVGRSAGR
jgi:DNA helicase-2/ATP-dependent DNA helicase PcrA